MILIRKQKYFRFILLASVEWKQWITGFGVSVFSMEYVVFI